MNKHLKYLWYIIRHKWYVGRECVRRGLYWRGLTHDLSKLLPSEWGPYTSYFYGSAAGTTEGEAAFDAAWLAHQHRNPHHWQHYVLREDDGATKVLPMPIPYLVEMVCDWIGAGMAIRGDPRVWNWYEQNKDQIVLHPVTEAMLELLLEELKSAQASR